MAQKRIIMAKDARPMNIDHIMQVGASLVSKSSGAGRRGLGAA
jgi:hypothetical protein